MFCHSFFTLLHLITEIKFSQSDVSYNPGNKNYNMNRSIILFCLLSLIVSCTNNSSSKSAQENEEKRNELELKEKELVLKEKELQLMEKGMTSKSTGNSDDKNDNESKVNEETALFLGQGDYISIKDSNKETASFVLSYSYTKGANRPYLEVKFFDDFEIYFNAVCDGDYFWCVRNENMEDVGYMKITFEKNGEIANVKIKRNALSDRYSKYLDMLDGKLHRK